MWVVATLKAAQELRSSAPRADAYAEKGWDATAVTHFKETWTCTLGWNVCLTGAVRTPSSRPDLGEASSPLLCTAVMDVST